MPPSAPNSLGEIRLERLRRLKELKAQKAARDAESAQNVAARFPVPADLAKLIDPNTVSTPALTLLDECLLDVAEGRCERLIWSMPPQEGKSIKVSRTFPLWMLLRDPELRIVIASYELGMARRWSRAIRNDILDHPELGLKIRDDTGSAHEWQLLGHRGGLYSVGVEGALTGRSADMLIMDDVVKGRAEADSETYRETAWNFWTETARTRLAPHAPVLLVMCIVAGMRVLHAGGYWVPVEKIRPGDKVVSLATDGVTLCSARVKASRCSGWDRTVTVTTDRLRLSTNDRHPYLVLRRGAGRPKPSDTEWVRARYIKPGDIVVTAKCMPDDHEPNDRLPDGSTVDAERAWLLGYLLGDGWVTAYKRKQYGSVSYAVCASIGESTGKYSQAVKEHLTERVQAALSDWSPCRVYETSGRYFRTDWNAGGRVLEAMGYGKGARNKRVPDSVWEWSISLRREFLAGYAMADGCLTRPAGPRTQGDVWTFGSSSAELLEDVRDLALTCGQRPTNVYYAEPRTYWPPNSPEPIEAVCNSLRINFTEQVAEGRSFLRNYIHPNPRQLRYEKVRNVSYGDAAQVYDLTIETTENFVAEGFIVHNTRWHEDDIAGRLQERDEDNRWRVVNIPAVCEIDDDPLKRKPGEYLISARGRTAEEWEEIHAEAGERAWNALYQGRPAPAEGGMFKRSWWLYDETPVCYKKSDGTMHAQGMDVVIQSWDMTFKNTDGTDFVVGQVWGRAGTTAHLLDQVRARLDFPETCKAVQDLSAKWPQASLKLIEDKANGPAVISQLRKQVPGMVPVNPEGNKQARAAAVTPFVEAGNVCLPMPARAPWVGALIEEASAFPTGAHDDQVDALTQALARLMLMPSSTAFLEELVNRRSG